MKKIYIFIIALFGGISLYAQNVGIDQTNPVNKLDINGSLSVGSNYSGTFTAPANGAIFEGQVGIGTAVPTADLDINGTLRVGSLMSSGNMMVTADMNGNLSIQPLPLVYSAGTGISISGGTILNTAPDQIINISGGGATSVSGTYPNFTISSTDNVNDADASPTNEIQTLGLSGTTLSISSSNSVNLSSIFPTPLWTVSGNNIYRSTGNVGIGASSAPSHRLVVTSPTDDDVLRLTGPESYGAGARLNFGDGDYVYLDEDIDDNLTIYGNNRTAIMGGNVGIGTINPTARLHVNGDVRLTNDSDMYGLDQLVGFNDLRLFGDTVGGPDVHITGDGNVGIGVSYPNDKLHVNGNIRVANDANIFGLNELVGYNDLKFSGDGVGGPDVNISASGNVGIGTVFPWARVAIRSSSADTYILEVINDTGNPRFSVDNNWNTVVWGTFSVSGTKNFILDHPLDPANKSLTHNAVESPNHVTYYHGTVVLDANGSAIVNLPDYFEALNTDFHYQLTCVGGFAQVYIANEIANNQFSIAGGSPGLKVSWQVTATRNDPYVRDNPYQVEHEKRPENKGKYWYPKGYNQPESKGIGYHENQR